MRRPEPQMAARVAIGGRRESRREAIDGRVVPHVTFRGIDAIDAARRAHVDHAVAIADQAPDVVAAQAVGGRVALKRWRGGRGIVNASKPAARGADPQPSGRVCVDRGDYARRHLMLRREHREPFVPQPRDAARTKADPDLAARVFAERGRQVDWQSIRFGVQPLPAGRLLPAYDASIGEEAEPQIARAALEQPEDRFGHAIAHVSGRMGDGNGRSSASSVVNGGSRQSWGSDSSHQRSARSSTAVCDPHGRTARGGIRNWAIGSGRHRACSAPSRRSQR